MKTPQTDFRNEQTLTKNTFKTLFYLQIRLEELNERDHSQELEELIAILDDWMQLLLNQYQD